ncbi:hypothetical protein, partial [Streptococcus dysgalactiae]|uniref:hypothetical protein n=1 Tax=Streptococcus dysgalactiae TaxID=1334 RepID=UPI00186645DA
MSREISFCSGKSLTRFLENPLRTQYDLIKLLLKTVQEIITPNSDTKAIATMDKGTIEGFRIVSPEIANEKMQRIFFYNRYPDYNGEKMYTIQSFIFPFKLNRDEFGEFKVLYHSPSMTVELDAYVVSRIMTLINIIDTDELTWGDTWVEELMSLLYGEVMEDITTKQIFYIVNEFLVLDFGYLRFDNDPKHEKVNHPRYHLDLHLNNKVTYKLGIEGSVNFKEFIEILDNNQ